jgi:hypothetical protein
MTYGSASVLVLASGLLAGFVAGQVRRRVRLDSLRRHHEIGSAVFLQMGVVFAVLLAFVFNEVWGEYNTAAEAISRESGDLRVAALLAGNLPLDSRESVKALIASYLSTVIEEEWPAMSERHDSPAAETRLRQLALGVTTLPMNTTQQADTRSEIAALLRSASQYRQMRLFQMVQGIPPMLWFMLLAFSVTLVGFLFFFGIDNVWSQMVFTGVFAAALALLLVILSMLDYPFEGAMRLSPAPFSDTLLHVRQMM